MASRYKGEFVGLKGMTYRIEIFDEDYVGAINEFTVSEEGFDLTYNPENSNDLFSPLMPSTCRFTILVNNAAEETLIEDIGLAVEGRFTIRVSRDMPDEFFVYNYQAMWHGIILPDSAKIEDRDFPYDVEITAVDGLASLKNIPYDGGNVAPDEPISTIYASQTFIRYVNDCLTQIGTSHFYTASDVFLSMQCRWFDAAHVITANENPLAYTRVKKYCFFDFSKSEEQDYVSCYEVLTRICTAWGARLLQSTEGGYWYFEQINRRIVSSYAVNNYNNVPTLLSNPTVSYERPVDGTFLEALTGGVWTFLPALRQININYKHDANVNILTNNWTQGQAAFTYEGVKNNGVVKLHLQGNVHHSTKPSDPFNASDYHRIIFRLRIKIGSYYLKRDYALNSFYNAVVNYDMEWTTQENDYAYIISGLIPNSAGLNKNTAISIITPEIPEDGDLLYDFDVAGFIKPPNTVVEYSTFIIKSWQFKNYLRVLQDGNAENVEASRIFYASNSNNAIKKDELEIYFGDKVWELSNTLIEVNDGTNYVPSTAWTVGQGAGAVALGFANRLANERLALGTEPRRIYSGTFAVLDADYRFTPEGRYYYQSVYYLFMGGTYNARMEEITGTYIEINEQTASIVIDKPTGTAIGGELGTLGGPVVQLQTPYGEDALFETPGSSIGLDTQVITRTTSPVANDISITNIPIPAATEDGLINAGDVIQLVNPATNETENFTVVADVQIGHTTIQVSPKSVTRAFPTDSAFVYPRKNTPASSATTYEIFENVVGSSVTVTVRALPETDIYTRLHVYSGGRFLIYNIDYTLDTSGINNDINFTLPRMGETVMVLFP